MIRTIVFFTVLVLSQVCFAASLSKIEDIPLPGHTTRFDYQSFDPGSKRLYFSHMGDGELLVFDTAARKLIGQIPGFPIVTGVISVPELHRVFASAAGSHEIVVVDSESLKIVARIPDGSFPDGLAYSPETNRVFISDESGKKETVIDAAANKRIATIDMGGEVGNTQYDRVSHLILANVQTKNELVVIDPKRNEIVSRHALAGGEAPHGLLIAAEKRLAFAGCEGDSKLLVIDLNTWKVIHVLSTGEDPDVLAFDPGLQRLYVACESGVVSIFQLKDRSLTKLEDVYVAPNAHTISVNPVTHELYLPLKNVGGKPVLRIMKPTP